MQGFRKYFYVFLITCALFLSAWYMSAYFNTRKLNEVKDIQNKVAVDILSSETQFSLLEELSCQDLNSSIFSTEIASLAEKIAYAEQNVSNKDEIDLLKKQYTILEVKDFLLNKRIGERCKQMPVTILYFYGSKDACTDCAKQGYVLDAIRQQYPQVRVYSFDYNLELSTIKALTSIYKIGNTLPGLVVNGKTVAGFQTVDGIKTLLPKEVTNPVKATTNTTAKKVQTN